MLYFLAAYSAVNFDNEADWIRANFLAAYSAVN